MAHAPFRAVDHVLEDEWQGEFYARLAGLCERVKLTDMDARRLNLYCRGLTLRQIGTHLGIPGNYRMKVGRSLLKFRRKAGRLLWPGHPDRWRFACDLLECLRNERVPDLPAYLADEERPWPGRGIVTADDLCERPGELLERFEQGIDAAEAADELEVKAERLAAKRARKAAEPAPTDRPVRKWKAPRGAIVQAQT